MKENYNELNKKHNVLLEFVGNLRSSDLDPENSLPVTEKKRPHRLVQEENYFFPNFYKKKGNQKVLNRENSNPRKRSMENRYDRKGGLSESDKTFTATEFYTISSNGGLVEPVECKKVLHNENMDSIENLDHKNQEFPVVLGRTLDIKGKHFKKLFQSKDRRLSGDSLKEIAEKGKKNLEQRVSKKSFTGIQKRPGSCILGKSGEEDAYLFCNPVSSGKDQTNQASEKASAKWDTQKFTKNKSKWFPRNVFIK